MLQNKLHNVHTTTSSHVWLTRHFKKIIPVYTQFNIYIYKPIILSKYLFKNDNNYFGEVKLRFVYNFFKHWLKDTIAPYLHCKC